MKRIKIIMLYVILLLFTTVLTGCDPESRASHQAARSVIIPSADGERTVTGQNFLADISHLNLGYLMVRYTGSAEKLYICLTGPDGEAYKYFMGPSEAYVTIPLTAGDGDYYFCAYEKEAGSRYSPLVSKILKVKLDNEFCPFLCSNQYVDFTSDSRAVIRAGELIEAIDKKEEERADGAGAGAGSTVTELEKVTAIYQWVIKNISYDYEKAGKVGAGYLPDVDETLKTKKGICLDYAALMTAMLRSQGIPAKLNIGYLTGLQYHSWVSVYVDEAGWVDGVIRFNGNSWKKMDPTVASESGTRAAERLLEDDENYIVKYVR